MGGKKLFPDDDFGMIAISVRNGARNISMRVKADGLYVTIPPYSDIKRVMEVLNEYRPKLLQSFKKLSHRIIDDTFSIDTPLFHLSIKKEKTKYLTIRRNADGSMILTYPEDYDIKTAEAQSVIEKAITSAIKRCAAGILPNMVKSLASEHGLKYTNIKISTAKSRWGSCSSSGTISLSCYLLLLPKHLIEYVILHELAHTKEMNHGPGFWKLLDKTTGGKALELRNEIRHFSPGF